MSSPCCPRTPEEAGACSVAALKALAESFPHLRPCPRLRGSRGTMRWVNRSLCADCPAGGEGGGGDA